VVITTQYIQYKIHFIHQSLPVHFATKSNKQALLQSTVIMSKRSSGEAGFSLSSFNAEQKKRSDRNDQNNRGSGTSRNGRPSSTNPFLSRPVDPEKSIKVFLLTARNEARKNIPQGVKFPIKKPFCEIEARLGIIKAPFGAKPMRVLSSGPKQVNIKGNMGIANAFMCTGTDPSRSCSFEGGVTKTNFTNWTMAGLSEVSSISSALGVDRNSDTATLRKELSEKEMVETVYGGYPNSNRICFPGDHHTNKSSSKTPKKGQMENKSKLATVDLALPAAPYDLRVNLSTERVLDQHVIEPLRGWTTRRLKRRRSYTRRNKSFAWQLDVTEVTTHDLHGKASTDHEIEVELDAMTTLQLVNEEDAGKAAQLCERLAQQLWWVICQLNPLSDVLDVEEFLEDHPNHQAVQLACAQCGALKRFMDGRRNGGDGNWVSAIAPSGKSETPSASLGNIKFPGCMPVNFSRHNIEEVQQSDDNGGYFLSEKTDGVRHLMVFTGDTVVLVDRAMKGKRPIPRSGQEEPMKSILDLINPGTVFDGEVVMHRKERRPVFIVFDVLVLSAMQPVLHLPFSKRLNCLKQALFRTKHANRNMFADAAAVKDHSIPLPLVRKNFVQRIELDNLLSHVVEEKGLRTYKNGELHNHLTDGIIFQPNLPYVCGTDVHLCKWKYLDTVTIDVQIMPPGFGRGHMNDDEDVLVVAVTGEEGSMVEMTRFIPLPKSELRRLEADRAETGAKIAEVGLEPSTGEWYYLTMRPDKIAPNHISTVLGTLLELAESLGTEELRYRMSVPSGGRDTYRKDMRKMQKQLLDHQRRTNKEMMKRERPA
jgi:hypothetical protein